MKKQRSSTPSFHLDLRHIVSAVILLTILAISFFIGRNLDSPSVGARLIDETRPTNSGLGVDVASLREAERIRNGFYAAILREAEHIRKSVTTDGAINMVPIIDSGQDAYIIPYFAAYASVGLDIAALLTKERDLRTALEYLNLSENFYYWYTAHMNPDGSIYDYTNGSVEAPEPTGDADSEDAYAGVFLFGAYIHYRVVQTIDEVQAGEFLTRIEPFCRKAANLIISLQEPDGLTLAKRDYPIQYLMDNLEAYEGLKALQPLGVAGFEEYAEKIATATNRYLWLQEGYFAWAKDPHDDTLSSGWDKWYPDKMANTWAIYFNFIGQEKRDIIYEVLRQEFSEPKSAYSELRTGVIQLAIAALVQRDTSRAADYIKEALKHQDKDGGFPDPYEYTHLSGWFIVAAGLYLDWNDLARIVFV